MDAAKLDVKNGYLDPHLICEAAHVGPESWKNDHPAFTGVKGKQARNKVRKVALQTARRMLHYIYWECVPSLSELPICICPVPFLIRSITILTVSMPFGLCLLTEILKCCFTLFLP